MKDSFYERVIQMEEMKDFWFSQRSFDFFEKDDIFDNEYVCEVFVDGKWRVFTEQIHVGVSPMSYRWGDLEFVGTSNVTRYTKASKWFADRRDLSGVL